MSSRTTRKWVMKTPYEGAPKRENLEIIEEELPPLKDGEFMIEAQYVTVDPYLRVWSAAPGTAVLSGQVGKVIETKNANYAIGDLVCGNFGWVTRTISDGNPEGHPQGLRKVDPTLLSPSTALGILGMTGASAYFGLLEVCNPKPGETLLVNAAAGAVGSAVGQIGKIKGMRVVGFAGSDEKVEYLKSIGFDAAYNYKTVSSLSEAIAEGCPNGVDVFFDNVGGEFFDTVLDHMNTKGRISCCGCISQYNVGEPTKTRPISLFVISKQLKIEGFVIFSLMPRWDEAFTEMSKWIAEGKLKYNEKIFEGFESTFDAFLSLFEGGSNIGKVVVKI